eukprot:4996056-Prymnesium_polylepis.1
MSGERWSNAPPSALLDGLRPVLRCGRGRHGTDCAGRASPVHLVAPERPDVTASALSASVCLQAHVGRAMVKRTAFCAARWFCGPSCNADRFETARIARV